MCERMNRRKVVVSLLACLCLVCLLPGCSPKVEPMEPVLYATVEEVLGNPEFTEDAADLTLEGTVEIAEDYVVGVVSHPEHYRFFGAQVVEDGFLVDTISTILPLDSANVEHGFYVLFHGNKYSVQFAIDQDFAPEYELLKELELSNGSTMKIGLE